MKRKSRLQNELFEATFGLPIVTSTLCQNFERPSLLLLRLLDILNIMTKIAGIVFFIGLSGGDRAFVDKVVDGDGGNALVRHGVVGDEVVGDEVVGDEVV